MELAKLLLKVIYLVLLYGIIFMILKNSSSLVGMNLMIMSLFAAVILMYFTFEFVYSFLISSEIIFKNETSNSEPSTDVNKNKSRLETDTKTHIDKENTSKNKFVMDHSHKFVQDNIFG
tara:strand:+ start:247 stop:603 length:357 start_codon:yes stop_codon:yes gene_type:complete